jgi:tight adherence protein B
MHLLGARNIRRVQKRVEPHVAPLEQPTGKKQPRRGGRFVLLARLLESTENALGGLKFWRSLSTALERADVPMRPAELFYIIIGSGSLIACISIVLGLPFIITLVLFLFGAVAPYAVVAQKGSRRQKAFDDQLPDLLMTMGASLRAGHTFRQSLQAVVEESAEPASKEFKRVLVETGIGRPIEQALFDVARRLGSRNFDYLVSAVSIQREVGGSLANLFDIVSEAVRQRQQFVKKVRGLTAMGRTSAYVLVAMPFFLAIVLSLINYAYMKPLFTTYTGRFLIIITLVMMTIGSLILKKIVSFRMA